MFIADLEFLSEKLLRARVDPLQEQEVAHFIDDIGQPDPHCGPGDADCSDEQPRLRLLVSKDMLDTRAYH